MRLVSAITVSTVTALVLAVSPLAVAQAEPSTPAVSPSAETELTEISPALADIPVDSDEFDELEAALTAAHEARVRTSRELAELVPTQAVLEERVAGAVVKKRETAKRLDYIDNAREAMAVATYTEGGQSALPVLDPDSANTNQRREVMADTVNAAQTADRDEAIENRDNAIRERHLSQSLLDNVVQRIAAARVTLDEVAHDELELTPQVARARVLAPVRGVDFPIVALDAYYRAAATLAVEEPECGVRWWALAGISRVEGRHGTFGGAHLDEQGFVSRAIIGIPLPAIGETDGGLLDGDPNVDHAVGPMQFIPSTWARHGRDGNGDGVADPQNLYDAALSAAGYLCHSGPGLDTDAGLRRGYFSYNHSNAYVEQVLRYAHGYERAIDLS